MRSLSIAVLAIAVSAFSMNAVAQDAPVMNYITQTTSRIVIPEEGSEEEMWKAMQEYYDKVLSKSTILKHYSVYRHAWGHDGATVVTTLEFENWDDIMKFNDKERAELEKTAWPDETARKNFLKKLNSYSDPYHSDEIYVISNTMRK